MQTEMYTNAAVNATPMPVELLAEPRGATLFAAAMLVSTAPTVEALASTLHRRPREVRRLLGTLQKRDDMIGVRAALLLSGAIIEDIEEARPRAQREAAAGPPPLPKAAPPAEVIGPITLAACEAKNRPAEISPAKTHGTSGENPPSGGNSVEIEAKNRPHTRARARDPLPQILSYEIASLLDLIGEHRKGEIEQVAMLRLLRDVGVAAVLYYADQWRRGNKAQHARSRTALFSTLCRAATRRPRPMGVIEVEEWAAERQKQRAEAAAREAERQADPKVTPQVRSVTDASEQTVVACPSPSPETAEDRALLVELLGDEAAAAVSWVTACEPGPCGICRIEVASEAAWVWLFERVGRYPALLLRHMPGLQRIDWVPAAAA